MILRLIRIWLGILTLMGVATGCATAQSTAFTDSEPDGPRIIAVGDIHGDWDAYWAILSAAGLIDDEGDWSAGETTFIQMGDIPDRGPSTRRITDHIRGLQKQAKRAGGEVIVLVGNHEAMMMTGDLRYVHPGEYAEFATDKSERLRERTFEANAERLLAAYQEREPEIAEAEVRERWFADMPLGKLEHQQAWAPNGEIGKWVARNPSIVVRDGLLFVHGGLDPAYVDQSVKAINKSVRKALQAQDSDPNAIINASDGPMWNRNYTSDEAEADPLRQAELDAVLAAFDANRMIVGHTPSRTGIRTRFDGTLVQIDTGASAHYGGTRSFLRIEGGRLYAHDDGEVTPL